MSVFCTSLACWQANPCLIHEESQPFDRFPAIDPFSAVDPFSAIDPFPAIIDSVDTSGLDDIIALPPPPFGEGFLFDRQSTLQDAHGEGPPPSSSPLVEFPQLSTEKAAWLGNPELGAVFSLDYQGPLELQPSEPGTFEAVILYGDAAQLESAVSLLKPGGKLVVQVPKAANATKLLLFAGLVDISSRSVSEQEEQVLGFKPTWNEEDVAPVTLKIGKQVEDKKGVWNVDLNDDTVELVDQDALLNNDAVDLSAIRGEIIDCGVDKKGAKKACKDCTCGLSDALEADDKAKRTYKSACGSCGLGDAFRCADCPYLGTPAFKPGEAVKLSL